MPAGPAPAAETWDPPVVDEDEDEHDHRADDSRDGETVIERAMRHATEATKTYPCRVCGGELVFNIAAQRLVCPHCGHTADVIENQDATVVERDFAEAVDAIRSGLFDTTEVSVDGEKEVVCQNCGGHTVFSGTLTATRCPYCATPIQRDDIHDAPSRLPVDGVLPFQIDAKTAETQIEKWINSRWFAPNAFKKYGRAGSFASVYAAYFTYDAETTTDYRGQRGDTYVTTVGSGENRRTVTRTRWRPASGRVDDVFDDVPVLANTGFEDKHIRELEPWPTAGARPYSGEYLAGHLSRTYDHDVEESFGEGKRRIEEGIAQTVRRDIGGDHQRISSMNVHYRALRYKHLLLPIWLLTVIYAQTTYQVFMNGVTGEVHGNRPYSKLKIALAVIAGLIAIGIALAVYNSGGSGGTRS